MATLAVKQDWITADLQAYWNSEEFQAMSAASSVLEHVHNRYCAAQDPAEKDRLVEVLTFARECYDKRIQACRAMPLHLKAFGW